MLVVLGVIAGLVTTVAGLGGGMLLLLALAAAWDDPVRALAVTTPALLVGNAHRAWLFRADLPRAVAGRFASGALAGALVGGAVALAVAPWVIQLAMVASTTVAVVQHVTGRVPRAPAGAMVPAGGLVGLASTAGGAGLLAGPVLQAAGLHGGAYLSTLSVSAIAMHVGRLAALAAGGAMTGEVWRDAALLAVGIPVGNALGRRARGYASDLALGRVEVLTSATLVTLSVAGLVR
jgi:uncharacterized membrane protein YfcA